MAIERPKGTNEWCKFPLRIGGIRTPSDPMQKNTDKRIRECRAIFDRAKGYVKPKAKRPDTRPINAGEQACINMLSTICMNAKLIPDPTMQGATDCWAVPLDDIITANVLLSNIGIGPPRTADGPLIRAVIVSSALNMEPSNDTE